MEDRLPLDEKGAGMGHDLRFVITFEQTNPFKYSLVFVCNNNFWSLYRNDWTVFSI